ncbi:uncharacterized protein LOC135384074 [Ornithodoros turicata]|uniref:uncharacterized protein LOC135384074 n=1 Tax=Ornithodoros turicata TaxID=34597 RepID=UPI00313A3066
MRSCSSAICVHCRKDKTAGQATRRKHQVSPCENSRSIVKNLLLAVLSLQICLLISFAYGVGRIPIRIFPKKINVLKPVKPVVTGYAVHTSACQIPDFDPLDMSIAHFYSTSQYYNCSKYPDPSFIEQEGRTLSINADILRNFYNSTPEKVRCSYQYFRMNNSIHQADFIAFGYNKPTLHFGRPLVHEYIKVQCQLERNKTYKEFFMIPLLKSSVEQRCRKRLRRTIQGNDVSLSILFLGVDSVSRLNSMRQLRFSREYLFKNFQPVELFGYTKVGDSSFPNRFAMLAGEVFPETSDICIKGLFNNVSWVWDMYSDLGYRTLFLEEDPHGGLFTYRCEGFQRQPTDYYPRPFMLGIALGGPPYDRPCLGQRIETDLYLSYVSSLLALFKNRPSFSFTWTSVLSHDYFNHAGYTDISLRQTFEALTKSGVMNKTLLIFLSDHGLRYGKTRRTIMGHYEDRLPFCLLMFPPAFRARYPELMRNLELNQHRLTTAFDIHATVVELAHLSRTSKNREFRTEHGLSLLHEIPENRTCEEASIDPYYCCCHEPEEGDVKESVNVIIAKFIVYTINEWLRRDAPGMCRNHSLKEVTNVRKNSVLTNKGNKYYWITIVTDPGQAILEGSVSVSREGNMTLEKLARLDMYRNQSYCLSSTSVERYCICI